MDLDPVQILHSRPMDRGLDALCDLLASYFRLELGGLQHIPRTGAAIVAPNHSGFAGLDVVMIAHALHKHLHREYKIIAHRAYFDLFQLLRRIAVSFGFIEAKWANAEAELNAGELLLLFPEAESGNFKSSLKRYQLQPFHSGFVRLAARTGAPIIPCLVVGAEESNFNLGNIDLRRLVSHLVIPLPVNIVPLPAKWRIEFLPQVDMSLFGKARPDDHDWVHGVVHELQRHYQEQLNKLVAQRSFVYFGG